jgi:hypothetical protein
VHIKPYKLVKPYESSQNFIGYSSWSKGFANIWCGFMRSFYGMSFLFCCWICWWFSMLSGWSRRWGTPQGILKYPYHILRNPKEVLGKSVIITKGLQTLCEFAKLYWPTAVRTSLQYKACWTTCRLADYCIRFYLQLVTFKKLFVFVFLTCNFSEAIRFRFQVSFCRSARSVFSLCGPVIEI